MLTPLPWIGCVLHLCEYFVTETTCFCSPFKMKSSANEHFRYYLQRNSLEEKELRLTLARIDEAKCESLSKLRRKKDSFVERNSRRMFMLHTDSARNGKWAVKSNISAGITQREMMGIHSAEKVKRSTVRREQRLLCRRERTTTISSVQVSSPRTYPNRLVKHLTEDCIKLPSIKHLQACPRGRSDSTTRVKPQGPGVSSGQETETSDERVDDVPEDLPEKISHAEKLIRTKSEISIMSIIPGSKLELFRQLSHRVNTSSTWTYLLRNVFERLTNGQSDPIPGQQGKPLTDVYDQLKACRYLRMPTLHKITPTYLYDGDDEDDGNESNDNESDDNNRLDE